MLDARTQEATKGGNDGGPRTTSAAVRSFVLISRLLIKPQPPKNKARKGEGEKMEGRVPAFFRMRFHTAAERRQKIGGLGGDYGTADYEGRPTKRGTVERKGIEKNETTGEEGEGAVLIQPNRNNYGDTHRIRNGGTISIGPLLPSSLRRNIRRQKPLDISQLHDDFANNYCMERHKAAFECLLRFPQNPIPCRLFQIPLSPTIIPR